MSDLRRRRLKSIARRIAKENDPGRLDELSAAWDEQNDSLLLEAARKNPNAFMEYAFEFTKDMPDGRRVPKQLEQANFQRLWQDFIYHPTWSPKGNRRAIIVAPRNHGKCVPDDGLVTLGDGSRVRAADLPERFTVQSWSEHHGLLIRHARKWRQHEQDVWRLTTRTGRELRVSAEHPLWTSRGWVPICEVRASDRVAFCRHGHPDLSWDEVMSCNRDGRERTWSIEVEDTQVHLVDDFVTHNTTQLPVGRTIWEIGNDPTLRIKIACQSDGKAMERLFEVTENISNNPRVKRVFPSLVPADRGKWTQHKIIVARPNITKDASIEALGILSTATGGRADLLMADDVCDRRNSLQYPMLRETIKNAWKSDWTNLLEPNARIIFICTLWHKLDLSHELLENKSFASLFYSVNDDMNSMDARVRYLNGETKSWNESLWEQWSKEALEARRLEIGSIEFDRAFRNIALSGDIAVVQPDWIRYFDPRDLPDDLYVFMGFDLAIGKKEQNDFFGCCVIGISPSTETIYVLDAWHARMSFMQQAWTSVHAFIDYDPDAMFFEATAYQEALPQFIEDELVGSDMDRPRVVEEVGRMTRVRFDKVPPMPLERVRPRADKMTRLRRVTPYMERGRVMFHPRLNPREPGFLSERGDLVSELVDFPIARNDDILDAFVHAVSGGARILLGGVVDDAVIDSSVRVFG